MNNRLENSRDEISAFVSMDPREGVLQALGWSSDPKGGDKNRWSKGLESISVFKGCDGNFVFRSGTDYGNIMDLAKRECGGNFGKARQLLRKLTGSASSQAPRPDPSSSSADFSSRIPHHPPAPAAPAPEPVTYLTPAQVKAATEDGTEPIDGSPVPPFLVERGFSDIHAVFRRSMRVTRDRFRNVIFPYIVPAAGEGAELVSREKVGPNHFKNYLKETRAGVWYASPPGEIGLIVVAEAPLDCISSSTICADDMTRTAFFALRSGAEEACAELVARVIAKRGAGARVEIRTDNDPAGLGYAAKVSKMLKDRGIKSRYVAPPEDCDDWTEVQEKRLAKRNTA